MLTADLVRVRRKGSKLELCKLSDASRERMLQYAEDALALAQAHVGLPRCDFEEAMNALEIHASDRKIALGLFKLVEDRCSFAQPEGIDPVVARAALFSAAAHVRKNGLTFDRSAIIDTVSAALEVTSDELEQALFADLRQAELLTAFNPCNAQALLEQYQLQQAQAVLTHAEKLDVDIETDDPLTTRAFFQKLKFFRLLFTIESRGQGRYHLCIDGPFSLFQASTKYGLQLACILPWLRLLKRWRFSAVIRWGKDNARLDFEQEGEGALQKGERLPGMPEEVQALLESFQKLDSGWWIKPCEQILSLKGRSIIVPDLMFHYPPQNFTAYLEVMGYWSRDAVWRRIEMVQQGLQDHVLFAVSSRLRVSAKALDEDQPSRLYVYKGVMNAKAVLEHLQAMLPKATQRGEEQLVLTGE